MPGLQWRHDSQWLGIANFSSVGMISSRKSACHPFHSLCPYFNTRQAHSLSNKVRKKMTIGSGTLKWPADPYQSTTLSMLMAGHFSVPLPIHGYFPPERRKTWFSCRVFITDRASEASKVSESPRDREFFLSSDVCQSGLEVTVFKRFWWNTYSLIFK